MLSSLLTELQGIKAGMNTKWAQRNEDADRQSFARMQVMERQGYWALQWPWCMSAAPGLAASMASTARRLSPSGWALLPASQVQSGPGIIQPELWTSETPVPRALQDVWRLCKRDLQGIEQGRRVHSATALPLGGLMYAEAG